MNISLSEIILVVLIALLVIKPEQLPEAMRALGKFARAIQHFFTKLKTDVNDLIDAEKVDEQKPKS